MSSKFSVSRTSCAKLRFGALVIILTALGGCGGGGGGNGSSSSQPDSQIIEGRVTDPGIEDAAVRLVDAQGQTS